MNDVRSVVCVVGNRPGATGSRTVEKDEQWQPSLVIRLRQALPDPQIADIRPCRNVRPALVLAGGTSRDRRVFRVHTSRTTSISSSEMSLPRSVAELLAPDDDPALWSTVLDTVAEDQSLLIPKRDFHIFAELGACAHWLRPHQTRWTAAGGFAWPAGYGDGDGFCGSLPNLEWRVVLQFDPAHGVWLVTSQALPKGSSSLRIAVPTRTARHQQAAVHTVWPRGTLHPRAKEVVFYGFRRTENTWTLKARRAFEPWREPVDRK